MCAYNDRDDKDSTTISIQTIKAEDKVDESSEESKDVIGIIGNIVSIDGSRIYVEGKINEFSDYDKAYININKETKIFVDEVLKTSNDLEVEMKVIVEFFGPVMEPYPIQTNAGEINAYSSKYLTIFVEVSKVEEYEGNIIISTAEGYRNF